MSLVTLISADTVSDLTSSVLPDGWSYRLLGNVTKYDQPPVWYVYDASSTATPDGVTVLQPTMVMGAGRYIRRLESYLALTDTPAIASASVPTRTLNSSAYQISSTRNSFAMYSVQIAATISLTTGQTGTVALQMSPTSGGTYVAVNTVSNGNTGSLTLGLNLTQTQLAVLLAFVPAGYFVKLVSTGTATNTIVNQQEVLL